MNQPLTDQQLNQIEATVAAATPGPWTVELEQCDCSDGLCSHGTYVSAVYADGERRTEFSDFPDADWQFAIRAREDVPALLAEVHRLRDEATELQGENAKLIRWHREDKKALAEMRATIGRLRAELAAAQDRVAELETYANGCDAEGCVLPHSSWCDAAKKTAAANDGCTCGKPWTGHPQPHAMHCWTVNPPRAEVEEMRKRIAELTAPVAAVSSAAEDGGQ